MTSRGLIVDLFAGGGGASLGIEMALGRSVDIAINHSRAAVAMHERNHPRTRHYCEDVFAVDPREAVGRRKVDLLWASPDCTHHSRAKGGKPRERAERGHGAGALNPQPRGQVGLDHRGAKHGVIVVSRR